MKYRASLATGTLGEMAISPRQSRQRKLDAARGYLQLELPQLALNELERVPDRYRNDFDCLILKGESLRELERHHEAHDSFTSALELRPENLQCLLGTAWCLKRTDQLTTAIETLERARTYHPDEPIIIYNLACYFSLLGNKAKAIECLGRSLRMEPDLSQLIAEEADFDPLRDDPDFQFVVATVLPSKEREV